jgi:hypothetical protein
MEATMARPKEGYELLQCTVSTEVGRWIRVMAAAEGCPPGRFVERHLRDSMESMGAPLKALLASVGQPEATRVGRSEVTRVGRSEVTRVGRPEEAPGSPQVRRRNRGATEAERTTLWTRLDAHMEAHGLQDGDISTPLGIAAANIVQWRKAGMVSGTQAAALEKLLAKGL